MAAARSAAAGWVGEREEQRSRREQLEEELGAARARLADAEQRLRDERAVAVGRVEELQEEVRQARREAGEAGGATCLNGCPLDLSPEIQLYREILAMVDAMGAASTNAIDSTKTNVVNNSNTYTNHNTNKGQTSSSMVGNKQETALQANSQTSQR